MSANLHRRFTLLLAIAMVAGPFVWLVMTPDGQRRTDLALLHLLGRPAFNLALEQLTPAVTEEQLKRAFPKVELDCQDAVTPFGTRRCAATIGSVDGVPARAAQVFFSDSALTAVRLDYQVRYHQELLARLEERHGPPQVGTDGVAVWAVPGGRLLLPRQPPAPADAALLWLAAGPPPG